MSDFLDRLAARAIDGAGALAPRLPSLFEPLSRAPMMPLEEVERPARAREATQAVAPAPAVAASPSLWVQAREPIQPRSALTAPAPPPLLPTPSRAATETPREPIRPVPHATSPSRAVAGRTGTPSMSERASEIPSRATPRPSRIVPARRETTPAPAPTGVLLPAPAPVFAATGAASMRSEHAATARAAAARSEGRATTAAEPVVHVSIGRLEVRAAPPTATPPRQREQPQPSSLDDYLRQRGKASP